MSEVKKPRRRRKKRLQSNIRGPQNITPTRDDILELATLDAGLRDADYNARLLEGDRQPQKPSDEPTAYATETEVSAPAVAPSAAPPAAPLVEPAMMDPMAIALMEMAKAIQQVAGVVDRVEANQAALKAEIDMRLEAIESGAGKAETLADQGGLEALGLGFITAEEKKGAWVEQRQLSKTGGYASLEGAMTKAINHEGYDLPNVDPQHMVIIGGTSEEKQQREQICNNIRENANRGW